MPVPQPNEEQPPSPSPSELLSAFEDRRSLLAAFLLAEALAPPLALRTESHDYRA